MSRWEDLTNKTEEDPLAQRLLRIAVVQDKPSLPSPAVCKMLVGQSRRARKSQRLIAATAAVVCMGLLVVNPAVRVAAGSVLPPGMRQELGLVTGSPTRFSPPATPGAGKRVVPDLTLAQAQASVSFPIPTVRPPVGFNFDGALVTSPSAVYLKYTSGRATIGLWIREGQQSGGSLVPSGTTVAVNVAGAPGYLVRGSYQDNGPGTSPTWNPNTDVEEITWIRGGESFDLTVDGLGLSNQGVVQLASTMVS